MLCLESLRIESWAQTERFHWATSPKIFSASTVRRRKHSPSLGQLLDASRGLVSIAGPHYLSSPSPYARTPTPPPPSRWDYGTRSVEGRGMPAAEAPQDDLPYRSPPSPAPCTTRLRRRHPLLLRRPRSRRHRRS